MLLLCTEFRQNRIARDYLRHRYLADPMIADYWTSVPTACATGRAIMFFAAVIAWVIGQVSRHGEMGPRSWRRGVPGRPVPLLDGRSKAPRCFFVETWGLERGTIA
jgi:hypothetical protein